MWVIDFVVIMSHVIFISCVLNGMLHVVCVVMGFMSLWCMLYVICYVFDGIWYMLRVVLNIGRIQVRLNLRCPIYLKYPINNTSISHSTQTLK